MICCIAITVSTDYESDCFHGCCDSIIRKDVKSSWSDILRVWEIDESTKYRFPRDANHLCPRKIHWSAMKSVWWKCSLHRLPFTYYSHVDFFLFKWLFQMFREGWEIYFGTSSRSDFTTWFTPDEDVMTLGISRPKIVMASRLLNLESVTDVDAATSLQSYAKWKQNST